MLNTKELMLSNVVLKKTLESALDSKEIKPVNPQVYQPWIFIGRTDVEVEVPVFWPSNGKSQIIGKDPDAGKDWRQEKKVMTEDERLGQHCWFGGHEFEQTLGDSEEPGSLVCCSSWGHKETDTTKWLNNNILRGKCFSKKSYFSKNFSKNLQEYLLNYNIICSF